jgi:hypothetical protein
VLAELAAPALGCEAGGRAIAAVLPQSVFLLGCPQRPSGRACGQPRAASAARDPVPSPKILSERPACQPEGDVPREHRAHGEDLDGVKGLTALQVVRVRFGGTLTHCIAVATPL